MCIFCKIVNKEIPCHKLYEDDDVLAFLDIKPANPGHILLIPKEHFTDISVASEEVLQKMILVSKDLILLAKEKLGVEKCNLAIVGEDVSHLHFHIIPRYKNDGLKFFPQRDYKEGGAEAVLKRLLS